MDQVFEQLQRWDSYAALCGTTVEEARRRVQCAMQAAADNVGPDYRAEHTDFNTALTTVLVQATPSFFVSLPTFMEQLLDAPIAVSAIANSSTKMLAIINNAARIALTLRSVNDEDGFGIVVMRHAIHRGNVSEAKQLIYHDWLLNQLHAGDGAGPIVQSRYMRQNVFSHDAFRDLFVPAFFRPQLWDAFCGWWFLAAEDNPLLEYSIVGKRNSWMVQFDGYLRFKCTKDHWNDIVAIVVETADGDEWKAWPETELYAITLRHLESFVTDFHELSCNVMFPDTN